MLVAMPLCGTNDHESITFILVSDTVCIDMFFIAVIGIVGMIGLNHSL